MLKAITFDLWGTLIDTRHSLTQERLSFLAQFLPGSSPQGLDESYRLAEEQFRPITEMGFPYSASSLLSLTMDAAHRSLEPESFSRVLCYWQQVALFHPPAILDGAVEVLTLLRQQGHRLALISDTGLSPGRVMRQILDQAGILPLLHHLTFSDHLGVTKRRPQMFRSTLDALGVMPSEALHVGDLLETDIRGAQAVGMRAAVLLQNNPRPEAIPTADLVLTHIRELPDAVLGW